MRADMVGAVGEKKNDEHFQRARNRPYHYGYPAGGKTIRAYTKEEWGIGASSGGGDDPYLIRSFYLSLFLTVLMAPVSLLSLFFGITMLFKLPIMALVQVFFGVLFGLGFLQCLFNIRQEWRARKARKLRGLPKPWLTASDHHAYEWSLKNPGPRIQMTLDYFPYYVKLRRDETREASR